MHVVNHWCRPIWTGFQISRTSPSDFEWCQCQRAGKLRSDLAENSAIQRSSDWWPHQQYALEHYPEKAQSCALFSWSIHQAPSGTNWRSDSSSKLSHYLYTWLSICSCLVRKMLLGSWICQLSMATIFSPNAEHVRTIVIWYFPCFPPLHDYLTWLKVEFGKARKKKPVSSILNMFFRSYPIKRIFKNNFHCLAHSRSTFPNSPLILYNRTLLHCFHFCRHPSEVEKSPPSTPSSLAICLAFPCKIGPLIGYPLAWAVANHVHKITLTSLCLTIVAFDKERLFSTSFSIKSLFSLAA